MATQWSPQPQAPPAADLSAPLTLALIGNILACVFLGLAVLWMLLVGFIFGALLGAFPAVIFGVFLVFAALGVVGTMLGFQGRGRVARGEVRQGATNLIVGGCLLILPATAAGVLLIIAGALASGKAPRPVA